MESRVARKIKIRKPTFFTNVRKYRLLYLMFLPAFAYYMLFHYIPMYGIVISFQNYDPLSGVKRILVKPNWVGLKNFTDFFSSYYFWRLLRNTFLISFYKLLAGFPAPLILALLLNEVRHVKFKKTVQTITYLPHFLSWVILGGMIYSILSLSGPVNTVLAGMNIPRRLFLTDRSLFRGILVTSAVWQGVGWGSIIYLAALSGINPELYESAVIDGASRFQKMLYISIPSLSNLMVILLIFSMGSILSAGFEQVLVLYSPQVYEVADIIDTYIYREGILNTRFSYSTAVGMFKNVVGLIFIVGTDLIAKKSGNPGLF